MSNYILESIAIAWGAQFFVFAIGMILYTMAMVMIDPEERITWTSFVEGCQIIIWISQLIVIVALISILIS